MAAAERTKDCSGLAPRSGVLKLSGEPVHKTNQLFEAKPGQISMGPQEPPAPPEQEEEVEDLEAA